MSLSKHPLIGIMGPAGAGKDTAANHLLEQFPSIKRAFAKPMYDMLEVLFRDLGIIPYWDNREWKEAVHPKLGFSPRQMLQELGTGYGRGLRPDLWHLPMLRAIANASDYGHGVVIPDVRFDDEAQLVLDRGGLLVYIDSPWVTKVRAHISNQAVWERFPCWMIKNEHNDLAGMHRKLDDMFSYYKIGSPTWPTIAVEPAATRR